MFFSKIVTPFISRFLSEMDKRAKDSEPQMLVFAIYGILNYPIFYFVWLTIFHQPQESLGLRLIAFGLCLFLALKRFWPKKALRYLSIYWYITLLYCLPFFWTVFFIKNHGSEAWAINGMLVLFLLILLVDWLSFTILLSLGIILGVVYHLLTSGPIIITGNLASTIPSYYVDAIVIGIVFSRNRENSQLKKKIDSIQTLGASIAHELRTPLSSINSGTSGVKHYLPALIEGYRSAQAANLPVASIPPSQLRDLPYLLDDISGEARFANTVIDMLLVKVRQPDLDKKDLVPCSMRHCINETLRRYPFDLEEKKLIIYKDNVGFMFKGNELFMIHVLFNLFKNALYHIKAARKGDIHIWLTLGKKMNKLYFKDTSTGIPTRYMPHLFTQFFTKSHRGTGLGLAFCKLVMESFGGSIICRSVEGEYTEFELSFPVMK